MTGAPAQPRATQKETMPHDAKAEAMDHRPVWETISTAPFGRDLELAVIEGDHVYSLVFACRRAPDGWVKVQTLDRVIVNPTHWRPWRA